MKKIIFVILISTIGFAGNWIHANAQTKHEDPEITAARRARDHAAVEELQKIVAKTKKEAVGKNSLDAYLHLALFQTWLCEALESHQDDKLFKQAAEDGVAAAEKAVQLDQKSSEAH